jgi:uncharacterized protein YdeI (YjbR/CyaY-like superfamily)
MYKSEEKLAALLWIFTAKQEKTRNERLAGFIKKLVDGKNNPYEK